MASSVKSDGYGSIQEAPFESSGSQCSAREAPEGARASPAQRLPRTGRPVKASGEFGRSSEKTTPAAAMGSLRRQAKTRGALSLPRGEGGEPRWIQGAPGGHPPLKGRDKNSASARVAAYENEKPRTGGAGLLVPRGNSDGRVAITGAPLAPERFQTAPRSPVNLTRL